MDAKKAHLMELELQAYYNRKKAEWDEFAANETAMNEGKAEGKREAKTQFVINLFRNISHSMQKIADLANANLSFVENIKAELL